MKRALYVSAAAVACLSLGACSTLSGLSGQGNAVGEKILNNLEACKRHYQGGVGAGVTLSFDISCDPSTAPTATDMKSFAQPTPPPGGS